MRTELVVVEQILLHLVFSAGSVTDFLPLGLEDGTEVFLWKNPTLPSVQNLLKHTTLTARTSASEKRPTSLTCDASMK